MARQSISTLAVALALTLPLAAIAQISARPGPDASPSIEPARWGGLAELAGHDYFTNDIAFAFRWVEPGRKLAIHAIARRGNEWATSTGTMTVSTDGSELSYADPIATRRGTWRARVEPNGAVSLDFGKGKFREWLVRSDKGWSLYKRFNLNAPPQGQFATQLARLVNGEPVATLATGTVAAAAPIAEPGTPMTSEMKAGLDALIGRSYREGTTVLSFRWLEPGKRYEMVAIGPFSDTTSVFDVAPDGRVQLVGFPGVEIALDGRGLPEMVQRDKNGLLHRLSYLPDTAGYVIVRETSATKPGKPPKWKLASRVPRVLLLPDEKNRAVATNRAKRIAQWDPLAHLVDAPLACVQYEPTFLLTRQYIIHPYGRPTNRSYPIMRLTSAAWIKPYAEMVITSTFGDGRVMKDRISLRVDGAFVMNSSGVSGRNPLVGTLRNDRSQGDVTVSTLRFPINDFSHDGLKYQSAITFRVTRKSGKRLQSSSWFEPFGMGPGQGACEFTDYAGNPTPLDTLPRMVSTAANEVAQSMQYDREYWASIAQDRAEGAAMVAGMRGDLMRTIAEIPVAIASVQQQQSQLDRLRTAAEQETAMKQAAQAANASRPGQSPREARPLAVAAPSRTALGNPSDRLPTPPSRTAPDSAIGPSPSRPRSTASGPMGQMTTIRVYAWCYATTKGEYVYQSGVGSREITNQEVPIQAWRSELVAQFRRQIPKPVDSATCNVDRDADFSYLQSQMPAAAKLPWTPS